MSKMSQRKIVNLSWGVVTHIRDTYEREWFQDAHRSARGSAVVLWADHCAQDLRP